MSLVEPVDLLSHALERDAERVALVDSTGEWTPKRLADFAESGALVLRRLGVQEGDRVLLQGGNTVRTIGALFAGWRVNAVMVLLHPTVPAARFASVCENASPIVHILDRTVGIPPVYTAFAPVRVILDDAGLHGKAAPCKRIDSDAPPSRGMLLYTSGSTSEPLGVVCPQSAMGFALDSIQQLLQYRNDDRVFSPLPLAFDYGLYQVFLGLLSGALIVLQEGMTNPLQVIRTLHSYAITVFPGLPTLYSPLLRAGWLTGARLPNMSLFTSTGETFPNQMIDDLRTCFPDARVQPMYGLTECKRVSILEANPPDTQRFSVGKPLPGTRAWVGDELGKPLAIGQVGELYVQGPHLMEGYWKRPDITAKRMITVDGVRTLRTGDHFSVNENGYLQFVSRGAGFLKSMGMRISPADVEQVLMALPGVVAALAVDFVDPKLGDRVAAIVQINNDQSENKLIELCRKMLPPAAVPVRIVLQREPLQLSVNGKYNRRALADYVRAQLGSSEG